ncbi:MAG TPA: hypothetical protein VFL94_04880, partial [Actinomycetales bacterium]|nr:hypothetical protein [Actinomycetales bacterium]
HDLSFVKNGKGQSAVDNVVLTVLAFCPDVGQGDANEVSLALSTSMDAPEGGSAAENGWPWPASAEAFPGGVLLHP